MFLPYSLTLKYIVKSEKKVYFFPAETYISYTDNYRRIYVDTNTKSYCVNKQQNRTKA